MKGSDLIPRRIQRKRPWPNPRMKGTNLADEMKGTDLILGWTLRTGTAHICGQMLRIGQQAHRLDEKQWARRTDNEWCQPSRRTARDGGPSEISPGWTEQRQGCPSRPDSTLKAWWPATSRGRRHCRPWQTYMVPGRHRAVRVRILMMSNIALRPCGKRYTWTHARGAVTLVSSYSATAWVDAN